jgi:hypothetical protein
VRFSIRTEGETSPRRETLPSPAEDVRFSIRTEGETPNLTFGEALEENESYVHDPFALHICSSFISALYVMDDPGYSLIGTVP